MAAPVGIWFFSLSCANTFGMFFLRAACSATKFTPNDQLTMLDVYKRQVLGAKMRPRTADDMRAPFPLLPRHPVTFALPG